MNKQLSESDYVHRGDEANFDGNHCGLLCVHRKIINDGEDDSYTICTLHNIRVDHYDSCKYYKSLFEEQPDLITPFISDKKSEKRKKECKMFSRLFGITEEDQLRYLMPRVIITVISLILMFFGLAPVFALVMMFAWGWNAVKSMFGIASIGIIFSGNVMIGVVIFVLYVILAYLIGIFCALLGIGRYIYLLVKKHKNKEQ